MTEQLVSKNRILRPKVPRLTTQKAPKVVVNIRRGPAVSLGQIHKWTNFWRKLIFEVRKGNP